MQGLLSGLRPDLTPAQIVGALAAGVGPVCVLLGVDLSAEQLKAVDDLKWVGLGLFAADTGLRAARNYKDGRVEAAAFEAPSRPPDLAHPKAPNSLAEVNEEPSPDEPPPPGHVIP